MFIPEIFSLHFRRRIFTLARLKTFHGDIAQLGERKAGSLEVRGSIPLVSTFVMNNDQ